MRVFFLAAAVAILMLLSSVCIYAAPTNVSSNSQSNETGKLQSEQLTAMAEQDPLITFGARGTDVLRLQGFLAKSGFYAGEIDGVFGQITFQAVKDFQSVYNLRPDGVVNKETLAFIERASLEPSRSNRVLSMYASAYTPFDSGCGARTYRGNSLRRGLVAVDPRVIPLGTRMYIVGYGYAIADDVGGSIKGNRIDLAFESRSDAFRFGVRQVTVYILD